jgi:hypothetical protein
MQVMLRGVLCISIKIKLARYVVNEYHLAMVEAVRGL